jgi:hypothetical protein
MSEFKTRVYFLNLDLILNLNLPLMEVQGNR